MKRRLLLIIIPLLIAMLIFPVYSEEYICDNAEIIAETTESEIKRTNETLSGKNGTSIHIYTGPSNGENAEALARGLFDDYGLEDRSVLFVIIPDEENYYLLRGGGLAEVLSENDITDLLKEFFEPDFSENRYDTAVSRTVAELETVLNDVKKVDISSFERIVFIFLGALISLALLLTVILFTMRAINIRRARLRRRRRRPNKRSA